MAAIVSNHDFTHGELDPTLFARSDLSFYNKCAQKIENLIVLPGGSVRSRFGTEYIEVLSGTDFQMFSWKTGNYDYLVILNTTNIIVKELSTMTDTTISHSFGSAVSNRLVKVSQQQNEFIIVNENARPKVLTSNSSTGAVTSSDFTFSNPPTIQYDTNYSDSVFTLSEVTVTPPGTATASLPSLVIETMGSFGGFSEDYVGGSFSSLGPSTSDQIGSAKIMSYVSSTEVKVRIDTEFAAISPAPPSGPKGRFNGDKSDVFETAYNSTRGWPGCITFFESRQVFASGGEVPQTLFFSKIGDFSNYDRGTGNDSDAIEFTIGSEYDVHIKNLISSRSLQIFTTTSEFSTPLWSTSSFTPSNVSIKLQTSNGSTDTKPITLDNQTFYSKRGGKAVMSFNYLEGSTGYSSLDVSVMSSHLVNNPVDMATYTVNDAYDSNILILINEDGSLVFYESLAEQNVSAWCGSSTYSDDKWLNVAVVDDRVFFIVKRGSNYLLEELDWTIVMDSYVKKTLTTTDQQTVSLGAHYANREVACVLNPGSDSSKPTGNYIGKFTADGSGDITMTPPSANQVYAFGFSFNQKLQTMPAHIMSQSGDTLYVKKKISKVYIQYNDSYSFKVNNIQIPTDNLSTGTSTGIHLDDPVEPKTGIYALPTICLGWSRTSYVDCLQDIPLHINILGISVQLNV